MKLTFGLNTIVQESTPVFLADWMLFNQKTATLFGTPYKLMATDPILGDFPIKSDKLSDLSDFCKVMFALQKEYIKTVLKNYKKGSYVTIVYATPVKGVSKTLTRITTRTVRLGIDYSHLKSSPVDVQKLSWGEWDKDSPYFIHYGENSFLRCTSTFNGQPPKYEFYDENYESVDPDHLNYHDHKVLEQEGYLGNKKPSCPVFTLSIDRIYKIQQETTPEETKTKGEK